MEDEAVVVLVTTPTHETALEISRSLLEKKLAACVNILPGIRSLYVWDGKIADDQEVLMIIKSRKSLFEKQMVPAIQEMHPYEVPEVIALPIDMGSANYLDWLFDVTEVRG